jgi:hypothetical protein
MPHENLVNQLFHANETRRNHAQTLVNFIVQKFENRARIYLKDKPDLRASINEHLFFAISPAFAIQFFLPQNQNYEHLKNTGTGNIHSITGTNALNLIQENPEILNDYIVRSFNHIQRQYRN